MIMNHEMEWMEKKAVIAYNKYILTFVWKE